MFSAICVLITSYADEGNKCSRDGAGLERLSFRNDAVFRLVQKRLLFGAIKRNHLIDALSYNSLTDVFLNALCFNTLNVFSEGLNFDRFENQ